MGGRGSLAANRHLRVPASGNGGSTIGSAMVRRLTFNGLGSYAGVPGSTVAQPIVK